MSITVNKIKNILVKNINIVLILLICLVIYKNSSVIEGNTDSPSMKCPDTDGYQYLDCMPPPEINSVYKNYNNIDDVNVCLPKIKNLEDSIYNLCLNYNNNIDGLNTCKKDKQCEYLKCSDIKPYTPDGFNKWLSCLYSVGDNTLSTKLKESNNTTCYTPVITEISSDAIPMPSDNLTNMLSNNYIKGTSKPRSADIDINKKLVPHNMRKMIKQELVNTSTDWNLSLGESIVHEQIKEKNNYGLQLGYDKNNNVIKSKNPIYDSDDNIRIYTNCKDEKSYCEPINSNKTSPINNLIIDFGIFTGICIPENGYSPVTNNPVMVYLYTIGKYILSIPGKTFYSYLPLVRLDCTKEENIYFKYFKIIGLSIVIPLILLIIIALKGSWLLLLILGFIVLSSIILAYINLF